MKIHELIKYYYESANWRFESICTKFVVWTYCKKKFMHLWPFWAQLYYRLVWPWALFLIFGCWGLGMWTDKEKSQEICEV